VTGDIDPCVFHLSTWHWQCKLAESQERGEVRRKPYVVSFSQHTCEVARMRPTLTSGDQKTAKKEKLTDNQHTLERPHDTKPLCTNLDV